MAKPKRLSKVARDLNVGISTIVDFLGSKGHEIDESPNTKLDAELYDVLVEQFQQDKGAREESSNVSIARAKKETVSIEEKFVVAEDEPAVEEVAPKKEAEIVAEEVKAVETPAPVKEEPVKVKEEPVVEVKAEEPVVEAPKAEKVQEVPTDEESKGGLKVLGKIDLDGIKDPRKSKKSPKAKKKEEAPVKEEPKKAAPKKKEEKKPVEAKKEEKKPESPVVEEKKKETPKAKDEVIKATVAKLEGPKVLGKIELPTKPEKKTKKPVASSTGTDPKKKRRRIRKVNVNAPANQSGPGNNRPRTGGGGVGRPVVKRGAPGKGRGREPKAELTEEEVSKKIKETLARLSGGNKRNKGAKHRRDKRESVSQKRAEEMEQEELEKTILKVTEFISANELASMMDVSVTEIISACMSLGMFVSINQRLDAETLSIVAEEFGYELEFVSADVQEAILEETDKEEDMVTRPPIVTVMGHVDHGKTSLLDYIRNENVIAGEAGGITQHIGAYSVTVEGGKEIAFLDTPGHEAFTAMRARGAQLTDICIIVIAADDQVMPQTKEAINHAQAAEVPMIIAINKMDKDGANPDKVKEELSQLGVLVEDWGGKYQCQEISAKHGTNINELLEKVVLEAEMLDLKASPNKRAVGAVIESSLDKGRGYVTNMLVQSGTLRIGDIMVAGCHHGKVKAMFNERNERITEAGPSTPILLLGLNGAPQAGDKFNIMSDEKEAKDITTKRQQLQREQGQRTQKHITLDEIGRRLALGDFKELNVIIKGDVDGSVEALSDSLLKLSTESIEVNIIHKSVGQISDSDIMLASASDAIIIGFQVRPSVTARQLAMQEEIEVKLYSIIYDAIEEVKSAMEGMLSAKIEEKIVCNIEIREVFNITKVGTIAGCMVKDGTVTRNTLIRIIRDGIVVHTGKLGSLKRFKDDVKEVKFGYECGLNIEKFNDIKVGDIVEGYEEVEVKQTL